MTSNYVLAGILALIAAVIGWGALGSRTAAPDPAETFFSACESEFATALVSPSSYRRIDATAPFLDPLTVAWHRDRHEHLAAWEQGTDRERDLAAALLETIERRASAGYQLASAEIRYESANRLGVPIAGRFLCETVTGPEGLPADAAALTEIWINGQDSVARRLR